MSEKKILEISVDEKDGEYTVRVRGERAAELMKCFPRCCCCCGGGKEGKAAAECC
jgi:hypothetical protein